MINLAAQIKTGLEQTIQVDYYKILGVNRNSTVQHICERSVLVNPVIEISH
jgi:phosphoribosylformylglycinamidine (FGAM) synthase PurS component